MARSTKKKGDGPEEPVTHGEVTKDNPSGIEAVSEDHARHLGGLQGFGGPGAAGAVVAGPEVHVATEGGTKPLPVKDLPEGVTTSGGAEPKVKDQPTSQAGALESGIEDLDDNKHEAKIKGEAAPAKEEENGGGKEEQQQE